MDPIFGPGAVPLSSLEPGERFTFPRHPDLVNTKIRGGWYKDPDGKRWHTGLNVAVIRITKEGR